MGNLYVYDVETDNLLDKAAKIHCLCYCKPEESNDIKQVTSYSEMKDFFMLEGVTRIGHRISLFDEPIVEKILGIKNKGSIIDTLPLAWYLEPTGRKVYGLESYGEEFGVKKPIISDWKNQTQADYIHRCTEDVKINTILWKKQWKHLMQIYGSSEAIMPFIRYIMFKMSCIKEQEEIGLRLDVSHCWAKIAELSREADTKKKELEAVMPKVAIKKVKKYPKAITKKDGSFSVKGELWFDTLKEEGLPIETTKEITTVVGYKEPNANSHDQVKEWLYSLGWIPEHIKHVRDKEKNTVKKIPQIASKEAARDGTGEICPSIKKLYIKEPKLELLEGLSLLQHRIGLLEGFVRDQKEGRLYPSIAGLTNTLRIRHSVVVNLPSVAKKYGKDIRGAIIANEGHILCGADLSGVEDRTKRHYIYPYDPKYVEEMNTPGYDPHLDIGVLAKKLTEEDVAFYKAFNKETASPEDKKRYAAIKAMRDKTKIINFSCTYKIGDEALARNSGMTLKESKILKGVYWQRNKAILDIERDLTVKTINGQQWLQNPVNGFWYSLRAEKDRFSTLNQGTAVYVFDIWLTYIRKLGLKVAFQYHDEWLTNIPKGKEEETSLLIAKAIDKTNEKLKLNIEIGCGVQFGSTYADTH